MDNETTAGPSAHRDTDEPRASPPLFVRRPRQRTLQMEEATQEHNDPSTPCAFQLICSFSNTERPLYISAAKPNRLLLLVKLTGSRLLALTLVIAYGTMKLIPALRQSALTWLDVLLGISTGIACVHLDLWFRSHIILAVHCTWAGLKPFARYWQHGFFMKILPSTCFSFRQVCCLVGQFLRLRFTG